MEIVKELNLNGNPQSVKTGSLIYAKNIKLSADGTYITNDEGFGSPFVTVAPTANKLAVNDVVGTFVTEIHGDIVGYINCPNEVVLLTSDDKIYRAVSLKGTNSFALYDVDSNWVYDGGKIIGTYTYNAYNHLIIAIAESNSIRDKELITIDLNESTNIDNINKYSCAPDIPVATLSLVNKIRGVPITSGVYQFFIRYEIVDNTFTNWFPIGIPYYAIDIEAKNIINHKAPTSQNSSTYTQTAISTTVNSRNDTSYNFQFNLSFNDTYNYKGYQIGYLLNVDDASVARIWKSFKFADKEVNITFTGGYITDEIVSVEDFTRNVINVYNVKAIENYNNKLYLGNFKETEYNVTNLEDAAASIDVEQVKVPVDITSDTEATVLLNIWTYTINGNSASISVDSNVNSIPLSDFPDLVALIRSNMSYSGGGVQFDPEPYRLIFDESGIVVDPSREYGGLDFYNTAWYYYTGIISEHSFAWRSYDYWIDGEHKNQGQEGFIDSTIVVTKSTTPKYSTYDKHNTIRTLMPFEVYSFYVHYVRQDGSYTNGIKLKNKTKASDIYKVYDDFQEAYVPFEYADLFYYSKIYDYVGTTVGERRLNAFGLKSLSSITEIQNKYIYELAYPDVNSYTVDSKGFLPYKDSAGDIIFRASQGYNVIDDNGIRTTKLVRIGAKFKNIVIPTGYVGAFFSYEKVTPTVTYQGVVTNTLAQNNESIVIKANDVEYANVNFNGSIFIPHHTIDSNNNVAPLPSGTPMFLYIDEAAVVLSNSSISFRGQELQTYNLVNRTGTHGGIIMALSDTHEQVTTHYVPPINLVGTIISLNNNIYSGNVKQLIRLGDISTSNVYGDDETIDVNYDMNYPSFIGKDNFITFNVPIAIGADGGVHEIASNTVDTQYYTSVYAKINSILKFSNINLAALSIKKEPEIIGGTLDENIIISTVVNPQNLSDLLELKSDYRNTDAKLYTNVDYNRSNIDVFTNVVRVTYPIQNESADNSWRVLNPDTYYVINNTKGQITNIFGAGTNLYIHTTDNLLVTSSDAKIAADNTTISLQNNNVFDLEPKELFTSDLGYGGLKHIDSQIFTQFGYIWYDTNRYKLFRLDNGSITDLTAGIDEVIKHYKFEHCYINIDDINNRILCCFVNNNNILTLGYSVLTNKWISIYDFKFNKSIHTANVILFNNSGNNVYTYVKTQDVCNYADLVSVNNDFPSYNGMYSCFDVIVNQQYNVPKVLNSISFIFEVISNFVLDSNKVSELKLEEDDVIDKYHNLDGVYLDIYTDATDSGLLTLQHNKLNDVANVNNPNAYKFPYYNKGVWNLNYFRNNVVTEVTDSELEELATKYHLDVTVLKTLYKVQLSGGNYVYRKSDLRSTIYGKYFVIRFVFKANKHIKFDNIDINISQG